MEAPMDTPTPALPPPPTATEAATTVDEIDCVLTEFSRTSSALVTLLFLIKDLASDRITFWE